MFTKILVALDLLDSNQAVFENALDLAIATQSKLMLLHALVSDRDGGPTLPVSATWDYYALVNDRTWKLYQAQWKEYEQRGLDTLRQYAQRASDVGIAAEFTQTINSPGRAICSLAGTWDADVIVVGSHRRTGLSELFLGSVSNYVMHHAPCSVLVAHLPQNTPQTAAAEAHLNAVSPL